ncbi:MAG: diacylglycerol kinase family lipid kinase [Caldilineae bacterium]|nr:MAG: diacylglycerol kinase family lipid kinase [Caldilineae bacterium]
MPAKIILNPYSNRWGAAAYAEQLKTILHGLGYEFDLTKTRTPNEGIVLAREAVEQGFDPVVAAGGDGTINEVVNGMLQAGGVLQARLGVLPLGSANDMAYQWGIPLDIEAACRLLVDAPHERSIDVGWINDRVFANDVTIAFGAQVNIEAATIKRLRGSLIYLAGVFKALARYRLPTVTFEWDDGKLENRRILLAYVGNGWRTGGVFYLTPQAVVDDGLLDFIFGDAMGRLQTLRLLPQTFSGSHIHDPRVHMTRCTWLRVTSEDPLPVLADGEIIYRDAHELDIRVVPGALRVLCGSQEGDRPEIGKKG